MEPQLLQRLADIASLCKRFGVLQLDAFGSAVSGGFDAATSDYDFIARFASQPDISLARRFLGFSDALEHLLGRPVDLMTDRPVANPYLRAAIDQSRVTVYAEPAAEALV